MATESQARVAFDCGNQTAVFTEFNDITMTNAYACGFQLAKYQQSSSASASKSFSLKSLFLVLAMVIGLVSAIPIDALDTDGTSVGVINITTPVSDQEFADIVASAVADNSVIVDSVNNLYIVPDSVANNDSMALDKRVSGPGCTGITQYQAANSGFWWSPWYPVSCCYYCDKGPSSCSNAVSYAFGYTWSVTANSGITFGAVQASTSATLSKSYTSTSTFTCNWTGGSGPAQIWYQQKVYWADMQSQHCNLCGGLKFCGAWSQYYRANAPVKDSKNLGCSVGFGNTNCDAGKSQACAVH